MIQDKPQSPIDHARAKRFRIAVLRMAWATGEEPSTDTYCPSHPFDRSAMQPPSPELGQTEER